MPPDVGAPVRNNGQTARVEPRPDSAKELVRLLAQLLRRLRDRQAEAARQGGQDGPPAAGNEVGE
jgi:hypothetical protein